jgi:hypothetical protein
LINAEFEYRIGNDLVRRLRGLAFLRQVEFMASKKNFIGINFKFSIKNLLATNQKVCHLDMPFVEYPGASLNLRQKWSIK